MSLRAWLLDAHPGIEWPAVIAAAEESGCRRPLLLALGLLKDVQQTKLPAKLEEPVEQDRAVQLLRAKVWKRLTEGPLAAPGTREGAATQERTATAEERARPARPAAGASPGAPPA